MSNLTLKRGFDLVIVLLTLPFWLPVLAVVSLLVWKNMGRPVFFRQRRPGYRGQVFELIKFRTMLQATDADGQPRPDAERLTRFGRWLRASSLDELPELINILRGEMSLVGPRPLLVEYLARYSPRQARRHDVPPGLTGLAQINGRNSLSWDEKFEWDVKYVESRSLALDLRILFQTAGKVFWRDGIAAAGEATMPEFNPARQRDPD